MSSGNRSVKYESLYKSLKKHYKPVSDPPERSVLECLLYACCLEDARLEQADEAFAKLQQTYFDWNEVRVTTVAELAEALKALPFPAQAAARIKQCLQSVFEARYQYDIDDLKKANLGKAVAEIEAWKGITPFVVAYVSQHALGGHAIPAGQVIYEAMWQCEILTFAEIDKKSLPGIERAIPKNKGIEFAGLLHQFANDLFHHPKSAAPLTILKEMGVNWKAKPKPAAPEKNHSSSSVTDANATVKAGQVAGSLKVASASKVPPPAKAPTQSKTATPDKGTDKTPDKAEKSLDKNTEKNTEKNTDKHSEKGSEKAVAGKAAPVKAEPQVKPSGKATEKPAAKPAIKVAPVAPAAHLPKPKVLGLGKGPLAKGAIKPPSSGAGSDKKAKSAGGKGQPGKSSGGKSGGAKASSSKPDSKSSGKPSAGKADASKAGKGNAKPANKSDKDSKDASKKPTSSGKSDAKKSDTSKKSTGKPSGSLGASLTKKKPK